MRGDERVARRVREQRALAEDRDDDRVRDHAREHGRDQRVRLEAVAVQDLDRQQRGAERRAEHRRDAGRDAGDEQDAPLARADAAAARPTSEPSAPPICIVGPSRPPAPPVPSVQSEASAFTQITRVRITPPLVVERVDHRVAAAAARLGRERVIRSRSRARRARAGARAATGRNTIGAGRPRANVSPRARSGT